jgi:quinol monooxygenase YgiN
VHRAADKSRPRLRAFAGGGGLSFHFLIQFEPRPGKEAEFREELLRVAEPTRAEAGCLAIRIFESVREPIRFAIHSEWTDEAAFDLHAQLPHTIRFAGAWERLLTPPVAGLRSREIGVTPPAERP